MAVFSSLLRSKTKRQRRKERKDGKYLFYCFLPTYYLTGKEIP
jgi:hypothetical protein